MTGNKKTVFTVLLVFEALLLMVPTTIAFMFGMGLSLLGFSQGNQDAYTPAFLYISGFLLLPGYALYSLWWVLFSCHKLTIISIPVRIWLGLILGIIITLFIFSPFRVESPTPFISPYEHFCTNLVFGLAPLVMTATLLIQIYVQGYSNK